jgi:asparagine synthase (glutamine-hydrolysing)
MVAKHCGTSHRVVELSPGAVLHHLDDSIFALSDPIGDPLTVPNALLFRAASQHVGVVLNGEGGDPCFGGPKNLPMLLSEFYPSGGRAESYLRAHLKCYDDLPEVLAPQVKDALRALPLEDELAPQLTDPRWPDYVSRLQAMNIRIKGGHQILPKVDALSAPFGVLARSPLFDRDIVELSLGIPARLKLNGAVEKYLLKRATVDLLPQAILDRPKSGMLVPVEGWFRGPLRKAARERLLDGLTAFDVVQRPYLERLLEGKLGGLRPRHGVKLWLLVTLESWLRQVLA